LCDSPPSNQAALRTYEKIYNSSSYTDVYCKFQFNTDNTGKVYLNNTQIGTNNTWDRTVTVYGNLKYGNNRIHLEVTNGDPGGAGGCILSCVRNSDNTVLFITDSSWKMSPPPPVNCQVNNWSDWGSCSKTCGTGTQARTRSITVQPANGGTSCPPTYESRTCNTQACPLPERIGIFGGRGSRYCADESGRIKCDRMNMMGPWEKFNVSHLGGNFVAIRGGRENKLCSDRPDGLVCNAQNIGQWEKFNIENLGDNLFAMKGGREGLYCSDRPEGMICNARARNDWEKLRYFKY
jgi:hypothetical protein